MLETFLRPECDARQVDENLFSVFEPERRGAPYDDKAIAYDRMVSSDLYLRIAWGVSRSSFQAFMHEAFNSDQGPILDLAAGTSLDACTSYGKTQRPTFVVDLSLEMLRKGKERVAQQIGCVPENVVFLQADALSLPFKDHVLTTILCHGAFHLLPSLEVVLSECRRTLHHHGRLFATSLVKERFLGNLYLGVLARLGEVSPPRSAQEVEDIVRSGLGKAVRAQVRGNFVYINCVD